MTRLELLWHVPHPTALPIARVAERGLIAAIGTDQSALLVDSGGQIRHRWPEGTAHGVAIGNQGVFFVRNDALFAVTDTGEPRWALELEAGAVGRLFAGNADDLFLLISRDGRFQYERYAQSDGRFLNDRTLERRRGMLSADGTRIWTRDNRGVTSFHTRGLTSLTRAALKGDGPMAERGTQMLTVANQSHLAFIEGSEVSWVVSIEGRDLRPLEDPESFDSNADLPYAPLDPAQLGRPLLGEHRAWVPDGNGVLHCLDLRSGTVLWRFEGTGYPITPPATPGLVGETLIFPCADEELYLLDLDGRILQQQELPSPFSGTPLIWRNQVTLAMNGFWTYALGG